MRWPFCVALPLLTVGCYTGEAPSSTSSSATSRPAGDAATSATNTETPYNGHLLTPSRLLRRVQLALLGRPPTDDEQARVRSATSDEEAMSSIRAIVDADLGSVEFYRYLLQVGHDHLGVGKYGLGARPGYYFTASQAITMEACPAGTLHAGKLGVLGSVTGYADLESICTEAGAPVNSVEPWWAPGTRVSVIGRAGKQIASYNGKDCGVSRASGRDVTFDDDRQNPGCSCGPNLVYCWPPQNGEIPITYHVREVKGDAANAIAFEEPARLFAHIAWHDRPLSDLVAGNYTVAPLYLRSMYVRGGRMNSANQGIDQSRWWDYRGWSAPTDPEHQPSDPAAWTEVVPESLNPNWLALSDRQSPASGEAALARSYKFDPRVDMTEPKGLPYAGVFTNLVSLAAFARERVRGARWSEVFACRVYTPPEPDVSAKLGEFKRDPATDGVCQHCHWDLDPTSIFFKRWGVGNLGETILGGVGPWKMTPTRSGEVFQRWRAAYHPQTILTPVTDQQARENPNAVLLDFLTGPPPNTPAEQQGRYRLYGSTGDGTIGPLGYGKILVGTGKFDECMVRRLYERVVGTPIDADRNGALVSELVQAFTANGRKMRPFLKTLVERPEMRRGL